MSFLFNFFLPWIGRFENPSCHREKPKLKLIKGESWKGESLHRRKQVLESFWIKKETLEELWCGKSRLGELPFPVLMILYAIALYIGA